MRMRKNSKRGMTLVELSVVLAVVAIVATMVVSFVVMVSTRRRSAAERLEALSDIEIVENVTESWIEQNSTGEIYVEESILSANGDASTLAFSDGVFYRNGTAVVLDRVTSVSFASMNGDNGEILYVCTVTYTLTGKGEEVYVFCVNPHVGEGVAHDE